MSKMKILIGIGHPAHVHFFKNAIWELEEQGHNVRVLAKDKDIAIDLLECYGIEHDIIDYAESRWNISFLSQLKYEKETYSYAKKFNPDVITGIGGTTAAHVSLFLDSRSLIFHNADQATLSHKITFPFADVICTPSTFRKSIGDKQIRYESYHELAWLHPDHYTPDDSVFESMDIDKDDKIVVMRLVSWGASHDIGEGGFENTIDAVERLEDTGAEVLITSERELPAELEDNQITISPDRIHDLLYYSDLFIGEGATMASESAILGTPAIYVSSLSVGYLVELEKKYDIVFSFSEEDRHERSLKKAVEILEKDNGHWENIRNRIVDDKINTSKFIINRIKNEGGIK